MKTMYELWDKEASVEQKLVLILDGTQVKRFHNVSTMYNDRVGDHSNRVALICCILTPRTLLRIELLLAALSHDLAECFTGDIPAPAKRELGIRDTINSIEDKILEQNGLGVVLNAYEEQVLKIADCADGMLKCISERRFGNRNVEGPYKKFFTYAMSYELTTLQWEVLLGINNLWEESMNNEKSVVQNMREDRDKREVEYKTTSGQKACQAASVVQESVQKANEVQVAGDHYHDTTGRCPECGAAIQHWDLYGRQPYLEGQITKYVTRWRDKNGLEDLLKARHYLDKLIEVTKAQTHGLTKTAKV